MSLFYGKYIVNFFVDCRDLLLNRANISHHKTLSNKTIYLYSLLNISYHLNTKYKRGNNYDNFNLASFFLLTNKSFSFYYIQIIINFSAPISWSIWSRSFSFTMIIWWWYVDYIEVWWVKDLIRVTDLIGFLRLYKILLKGLGDSL